jgi:hypothetical protein
MLLSFSTGSHASDWVYTVRPGDSIWQLSQQYLKEPNRWPEVQQRNNVTEAQAMQPGTRLSIPVEWLKHQPKAARIVASHGEVALIRGGKTETLTTAATIISGDTLRSGSDGSATVEFADGSQLLLQPNSEIVMDSLGSFDATGMVDTSVRIKKGRVENRVAPQKPESRYRIITPAAVAAVRGTEFRAGGDNDGSLMRNEVLEGKIAVTGSGVTREVPTGYGTVAESGKPPTEPQPLPSAPDLSGLSKRGSQAGITLRWPAVDGAVHYRAQLAPDERFTVLLKDELLAGNQLTWSGLPPADYTLRVRAINAPGLEGFDARHRFTILAPLAAPRPTTPEDGAVLAPGKPFIAWSQTLGANSYHLQLASDAQFGSGLLDIGSVVNNNYRPVDDLPPGRYYWRVASVTAGVESDFNTPRHFVISAAPAAPGAIAATLKQRDASFSWSAVSGAVQYQFQLGPFEDFTALTVDAATAENSYTLNQLAPGRYHYRLRAVNGDGRSGPFSPAGVLLVESK